MSDERRNPYHFNPSPDPHAYAFPNTNNSAFDEDTTPFYESLLSNAFGLSPSSSDVFSSVDIDTEQKLQQQHPNSSSVSSSSNEAVGGRGGEEEDSAERRQHKGKDVKDQDSNTTNKKGGKVKNKVEKKEKEARVSFMTKSEVDHLEDGYRWRKYGQKAVKNSPYPRSYYRCTTQKCTVKKRVERSYQDPSIVVTTYEGQHNHHIPATLRGHAAAAAAAGILSHHPLASFQYNIPHHQDLFLHMAGHGAGIRGGSMAYNINTPGLNSTAAQAALPPSSLPTDHGYVQLQSMGQVRQQQMFNPDYGLLQDMVPSFLFKQES